jgi:hypothetical protein
VYQGVIAVRAKSLQDESQSDYMNMNQGTKFVSRIGHFK